MCNLCVPNGTYGTANPTDTNMYHIRVRKCPYQYKFTVYTSTSRIVCFGQALLERGMYVASMTLSRLADPGKRRHRAL